MEIEEENSKFGGYRRFDSSLRPLKNFFVYTTGKLCRQVWGSTREISRKIFPSRAGAKSQSEEFANFSGVVNV